MNSPSYPPPLRRAIKEALKSDFRYRLGAVVANKNKIISAGHNSRRHHKYSDFYSWKGTCHAETAAILKAPFGTLAGSTVYVARVNAKGKQLLSKPCHCCLALMHSVGVAKVIYTTDKDCIEMKLNA